MEPFSRSERRRLRELAGLAHERELASELARLEEEFREWRKGRRSPHDVSESIHEFHDGVARELYGLYTRLDLESVVARAIALRLLDEDEVPRGLRHRLGARVEFFRHPSDGEGPGVPEQAG
jgi:hypothetical protein